MIDTFCNSDWGYFLQKTMSPSLLRKILHSMFTPTKLLTSNSDSTTISVNKQ